MKQNEQPIRHSDHEGPASDTLRRAGGGRWRPLIVRELDLHNRNREQLNEPAEASEDEVEGNARTEHRGSL